MWEKIWIGHRQTFSTGRSRASLTIVCSSVRFCCTRGGMCVQQASMPSGLLQTKIATHHKHGCYFWDRAYSRLFLAFFWYKNPGNKLNVSCELRKVRIHLHSSTFVHTAFSNTFVTDRAVISLGRSRPSPHTQNFTCAAAAIQLCIAIVCRLNGLQLCNPCKYMDYYSLTDQIGMEGWDGLVLSLQTVMLLRDKIIVLIMLGKYKFSKTRWIPTLFHEFSPTVFELPDLSGFP